MSNEIKHLQHKTDLGVQHFVLDFGHPKSLEPVHRQVIHAVH